MLREYQYCIGHHVILLILVAPPWQPHVHSFLLVSDSCQDPSSLQTMVVSRVRTGRINVQAMSTASTRKVPTRGGASNEARASAEAANRSTNAGATAAARKSAATPAQVGESHRIATTSEAKGKDTSRAAAKAAKRSTSTGAPATARTSEAEPGYAGQRPQPRTQAKGGDGKGGTHPPRAQAHRTRRADTARRRSRRMLRLRLLLHLVVGHVDDTERAVGGVLILPAPALGMTMTSRRGGVAASVRRTGCWAAMPAAKAGAPAAARRGATALSTQATEAARLRALQRGSGASTSEGKAATPGIGG